MARQVRYGRTVLDLPADYTIYQDGNYILAENKEGKIEFKGTDATTVIQSAIDALTDGGKIFIKQGDYYSDDISTPLTLNRNIQLIGEGYEITKLNFPVKLGVALNKLIGLSIINPNLDKTGVGLLAELGSEHVIDNVVIKGWEEGFKFATTDAFGDVRIGRLFINSCKYALRAGSNYHYYFLIDKLEISSCDGLGNWNPQYSHIRAINISGTGSELPSSLGGQATTIDVLFLENSSRVYFSQGGYGGFNGCTIHKAYVTSGSKLVFGNVQAPSYVYYLHVSSDSTLETWVNDIYIRAPDGIGGTLSIKEGNPKIFGVENSGITSITGDGSTTSFTVDVEHGLNEDDPNKIAVIITPSKAANVSYEFVDTNSDDFAETLRITLNFASAPMNGETVYISWRAVVVYA